MGEGSVGRCCPHSFTQLRTVLLRMARSGQNFLPSIEWLDSSQRAGTADCTCRSAALTEEDPAAAGPPRPDPEIISQRTIRKEPFAV